MEADQKQRKNILLSIFENVEIYICVISISAMTLITFVQVIGRYVFNHSFSWSEEICRFLLAWITFGGSAYAFKQGAHIGVTYLVDKLPPTARKCVYIFIQILTIGFFAMLGYYGLKHTLHQVSMNQIAPATRISIGVPYSSIPVGSALVIIRLIIQTVEKLKEDSWEVNH